MIKSITVTNYLGEELTMELSKPEKSGFIVTSITGLGPGSADISTAAFSTTDGGRFSFARIPERNIVLSLRYFPTGGQTAEGLRHKSYIYFPLKKKLTLTIETDQRIAHIEGYVESNDPSIFSKTEASDISIICPNPFFYTDDHDDVEFRALQPLFEFPFSNESLTEPMIEFSTVTNDRSRIVDYEGDADTGMVIKIHCSGRPRGMLHIYNVTTLVEFALDLEKVGEYTGAVLSASDDIYISTGVGEKYVYLLRNGVYYNILNCISTNSSWPYLVKGENEIAYQCEAGSEFLEFTINYNTLYEGI